MTPEMLAILRTEILTDPAKRGYDVKDAQKTADLLNVPFMGEVTPAKELPNQPLRWGDVRGVAQATGEWPNIVIRAEERPATNTVKAAINARATEPGQMIDPTDPRAWGAFQAGLQLFEAAGDLSAETVAAIQAMATVTIPAVVAEQHPRIMEIFIQNPVEFPEDFTRYEASADDVRKALS